MLPPKENKGKRVLVLLGPTGSGKTEALSRLDGAKYEVISCDSRQVYRGLEITTASPEPDLQKQLPHHLLSILSPQERFTAGQFVSLAERAIEDIHKRGKQAVLSGGAGFYFRALRKGMFPIETPLEVRQKVEKMSAPERLKLLKELDPQALVSIEKGEAASQGRIHPNDHYRVLRALEITLASASASASDSKKWSTFWQEAQKRTPSPKFDFIGFWLNPVPSEHKEALFKRAQKMVHKGIIEEAGQAYEKYGLVPSLAALGCKEALEVYLGQAPQEDLAEKLAQSHHRYAKKQRLWLRKEDSLSPILPKDFAIRWEKLV